MKVCIIGDHSPNLDEGLKNIAFYLAEGLSKHHPVVKLNIKKVFTPNFWRGFTKSSPEIIHYVPGPTIKSFIIVKVLQLRSGAKTVMSAPQPVLPSVFRRLVPLFKPDLVLAQSSESEAMFRDLGCKTMFLPNGVNTERFTPVSSEVKGQLREKYGIESDKFVVLHVGPLTKRRNLQVLGKIQGVDARVIIVGSRYQRIDRQLHKYLNEGGCLVLDNYVKDIEEIYALSDCYIFPVRKGNTILCPLSVMEAMSCNLPVISTRFDGLASLFKEGDGLIFAEKEEDVLQELPNLKNSHAEIRTREKVLPYSWESIVAKLEEIYKELIS